MKLPKKLVSEFVKVTNTNTKTKTEATVYGTIVKNGESTYAQLDGSEILTPVSSTTDTQDGDRVTILIKNHTATVTGNLTSPAARTDDVQIIGGDVQQLGGDVSSLAEENLTLSGKLTAVQADIETLNVNITNLEATHAAFETATAQNFEAMDGKINNIVVEGTSGIWSYKKWSNGNVELWGNYSVSDLSCSTKLGDSMYRTDAISITEFPFTVYTPNLTASYESDGYGGILWATSTTTQQGPPSYYLLRPTSATIVSGKINFHVYGKWSI